MTSNGDILVHINDIDSLFINAEQITSRSSVSPETMISDDESLLVSDDIAAVFFIVFYAIICPVICCIGVVSNIINMIVFKKLGFQETVNVCFFSMAISDFAASLTLVWVGICANPYFQNIDIPFIPYDILVISGIWPHYMFARITGWLTAVVSLERCFCVIFPLKVKAMLTLGRIKAINVLIFILVIASFIPSFSMTRLIWMFIPIKNRTMLGLGYTSDWEKFAGVASLVNSTVPSFSNFIIVLVATWILVVSLKRKTKWRQTASATLDKDQQAVVKDKKVIRLLIAVATIFIICLFPTMIVNVSSLIDPEFGPMGKRMNLLTCVGSIAYTIEAINSSVNIFVYYTMSSKYKQVFLQLFQKQSKDVKL